MAATGSADERAEQGGLVAAAAVLVEVRAEKVETGEMAVSVDRAAETAQASVPAHADSEGGRRFRPHRLYHHWRGNPGSSTCLDPRDAD